MGSYIRKMEHTIFFIYAVLYTRCILPAGSEYIAGRAGLCTPYSYTDDNRIQYLKKYFIKYKGLYIFYIPAGGVFLYRCLYAYFYPLSFVVHIPHHFTPMMITILYTMLYVVRIQLILLVSVRLLRYTSIRYYVQKHSNVMLAYYPSMYMNYGAHVSNKLILLVQLGKASVMFSALYTYVYILVQQQML